MPSSPTTGPVSSNTFVNALQWGGWRWDDGSGPGTNITYYFRGEGWDLDDLTGGFGDVSAEWYAYEQQAYRNALQEWANVANITFTEVTSYGAADFVEYNYEAPGTMLGVHETPDDAYFSDGTAWGGYAWNGRGWSESGLNKGGFGYITLVHEIGHALGLAHPHDDGGGSSLFPGVTDEFYDYGDNDLNQGIFTVMSYNDGWHVLGQPTDDLGFVTEDYGYQSGPMAFDIAAIQNLYGANTKYHKGNDTYILGDANGVPVDISCIWDAGGTDTIQYDGIYNATIDLRAATLKNEPGGGGFVSYINGAPATLFEDPDAFAINRDHWDAVTIANGVVIENATGGSGNDKITGNASANTLTGNAGKDTMTGGDGNDIYVVDSTGDKLTEASGVDTVRSSVSWTLSSGFENLILIDTAGIHGTGNSVANTITGNSGKNTLKGLEGNDTISGGAGDDTLDGGVGKDTLDGGKGNDIYVVDSTGDKIVDSSGIDSVHSPVSWTLATGFENLTLLGTANINGVGNSAANTLVGNSGKNTLSGEAGKDLFTGGKGADIFDFNAIGDSKTGSSRDQITDFSRSQKDKIDLSGIDANTKKSGNQAFKFIDDDGFGKTPGELRFKSNVVQGDVNGDGKADFEIGVDISKLVSGDFIL